MNQRVVLCLSTFTLAALVAAGCNEDLPSTPGDVGLEVSPRFDEVIEGDSIQLEATIDGEEVDVTWSSADESIATVNADGWVRGVAGGFAGITAALASNPEVIRSASVTVTPMPVLEHGDPTTGISADGVLKYFKFEVPAGTTNLVVTMTGANGDADLYVRQGARPTYSEFNCRPWAGGSNETCPDDDGDATGFDNPTPGWWYVMIDPYEAYTGLSLEITLTPAP